MAGVKLFFFFMDGCGACAQAKPHLDEFARRHPEVKVERKDVHRMRWPRSANWRPAYTPSYVIAVPGKPLHAYEHPMTLQQLEAWLAERTRGE